MRIVALTDIHGNISAIERLAAPLAQADLVLLTGDLTHFGGADDAARVLAAVRDHNRHVRAVAGNCDQRAVADWLQLEGISLHARHEVIEDVVFLGLGGSLPAPGRTPNEFTDAELAGFLDAAAAGLSDDLPWVLVSHEPPADTALDMVSGGRHVGSASVRRFIERHRPLACFTGHIHEAAGTDSIGPTRLANPGPARGGRYAYAEVTGRLVLLEIRQVELRSQGVTGGLCPARRLRYNGVVRLDPPPYRNTEWLTATISTWRWSAPGRPGTWPASGPRSSARRRA